MHRDFCRSAPALAALAFSLALSTANDASAEMQFSIYGGFQTAPHSDVDLSDGTHFTAGWEGKSFSSPPYYGGRATWWLTDFNYPNLGFSIDYTHAKVYADQETLKETGWSHFEFTDGLNLLTANALYRFQKEGRKWTPYVGAGVGVNIPHVEVTRPSGTTFGYEFGGVTLQAQAGISYQITSRWSAFAEYKGNYSFVDVPIDNGDRLKTDILTNAVNVGLSFHW
ncbi:outer membrane beta-barrel protein [Rhizobium sp. BK251]|uniref:outer membrane protein n=1 Tax=Rhizobium sp. BK251 TaxID=2512125 RepID=UPI00104BCBDE|nr:outer membrane beta-barrel protein [Rhizobium sp. BK251]TCL75791.1 lipid A oxidase [Rhizobium sp. BK251]